MHKFITKYSPDIAKGYYRNAKCKMLSPKIQYDILQTAAIALVQVIKIEILDSHYSILADETRDSCSNELIAVCIRYPHRGDIREWAVGFVDGSSDLSAKGISNSILSILEQLELDPDKYVGFGFDGASVMSGNRGGVQAILRRTYTRATYVRCHSHRLNFLLQQVATKDEDVKVFFSLTDNLVNFFRYPKRNNVLKRAQEILRFGKQLVSLPPLVVWWSSNALTVEIFAILFPRIIDALE